MAHVNAPTFLRLPGTLERDWARPTSWASFAPLPGREDIVQGR
jgi:hypothetical protein